jgi:alkanesulfonate monooxygenase SsuD/methylene tetrahydromethanopterin reductase-like flavin-dependent oxidoreductase (luciferase family)
MPAPERRGPVVGLMLPASARTDDGRVDAGRVIEAARRAESFGIDGVYVGDHLLHPRPLLESVVTLAAVAASTQRVALGPCVMLVALRHPLVLAKQLATLACFAPGRLRVGVGVGGEYPAEFDAVGVPLSGRGRRMEEALGQVRALLAGRPVPSGPDGGDHRWVIAPAAGEAVPFLLAGHKEASLRRAARCGDGWIGYLLSPDGFARRRSALLAHRVESGAPAEAFTTGMLLPVLPVHPARPDGGVGARARATALWGTITANDDAAFPERLFVAGPPDEIVDQLRAYWDAGCTEMVLAIADQGAGYLDALDTLAGEVLPRVRSFT